MNFFHVLGLIFIILKLTGFIDWSWWLVLLPLYFGLILFLIFFIIGLILVKFGNEPEFKIRIKKNEK